MRPEPSRLYSPKRSANAARRSPELIFTPPSPEYDEVWSFSEISARSVATTE